jgi:hypothetical protein
MVPFLWYIKTKIRKYFSRSFMPLVSIVYYAKLDSTYAHERFAKLLNFNHVVSLVFDFKKICAFK